MNSYRVVVALVLEVAIAVLAVVLPVPLGRHVLLAGLLRVEFAIARFALTWVLRRPVVFGVLVVGAGGPGAERLATAPALWPVVFVVHVLLPVILIVELLVAAQALVHDGGDLVEVSCLGTRRSMI